MVLPPVRFGIIGDGEIERKESRAILLSPNATITSVCCGTFDKSITFATNNHLPGLAKVHGSYEAILADGDVDAVYIALPPSLHLQWAVAAANTMKNVLLETHVELNVEELDKIMEACDANTVWYMDATMWMHHPRTLKMEEFLSDSQRFGQIKAIQSIFSFNLGDDIRANLDLNPLGALGDTDWYCIRAILWVNGYTLPKTVTALRDVEFNEAGVILSCGASMSFENGTLATFYCSFLSNLTMDMTIVGSIGTLHLHDFVITFTENVAQFYVNANTTFTELSTRVEPALSEYSLDTDLPQETIMVSEFWSLLEIIREIKSEEWKKWPTISRKTRLVVDVVKISIEKGFETVEVVY